MRVIFEAPLTNNAVGKRELLCPAAEAKQDAGLNQARFYDGGPKTPLWRWKKSVWHRSNLHFSQCVMEKKSFTHKKQKLDQTHVNSKGDATAEF